MDCMHLRLLVINFLLLTSPYSLHATWSKQRIHYYKERSVPLSDTQYWKKYGVSSEKKKILKNKEIKNKTISVIIPCYYLHARQLPSLLRLYEQQTRLPDEIVISLSEADNVDQDILNQLQSELWAFPVTLIISNKKQYAAENRNIACSHAQGDIFLCQDADDIPHPQRVEIIHYFFCNYNIDHLMHRYQRIEITDKKASFEKIDCFDSIKFTNLKTYDSAKLAGKLTNGNIALTRKVFKKIKWVVQPRAEDVPFNRSVYERFRNCIVIETSLYGYRQFLSSLNQKDIAHNAISVQPLSQSPIDKCYSISLVVNSANI